MIVCVPTNDAGTVNVATPELSSAEVAITTVPSRSCTEPVGVWPPRGGRRDRRSEPDRLPVDRGVKQRGPDRRNANLRRLVEDDLGLDIVAAMAMVTIPWFAAPRR